MANTLTITTTVNSSVNGLNVSGQGAASYTPTGSIAFAESIFIPTGSYTLVFSGSAGTTYSVINILNSGASGSIQTVVSGSNGVPNSLGSIPGIGASTNNSPSVVQWNQTLNSIWATSVSTTSGSYGVFNVFSQ